MNRRRTAGGMAIIGAIMLIVVLAGLGAAVASLSGVQTDTQSKSLLAAKAYYGARAGLEYGIQRALGAGSCAAASFTLTEEALNGVSVSITCAASTFAGGNVYRITSTATTGTLGQLNYAERRLSAGVATIP